MEKFINFIIDLADEELGDYLDGDVRHYFLNGGCYEFAIILNNYVEGSKLVINKDSNHCAILHSGNVYDVTGKVEEKDEFDIATNKDKEYIEFRFGIMEKQNINGKRISHYLIETLDECYLSDMLKAINEKKGNNNTNNKGIQNKEVDGDER